MTIAAFGAIYLGHFAEAVIIIVLFALGETNRAREAFVAARNLDSMPWRAPSSHQEAIKEAAAAEGAPVCDMEHVFRANSPGGCIGWELMDDHVHPSLRGQALMAEALVETLFQMDDPVSVSSEDD